MNRDPPAGPYPVTGHACNGDLTVGRDRELAELNGVFDAAGAGRPAVVLLTGEAGIGKTRLADEAASMARIRGMRVLRGEADPSTRQPMELWRGVYHSLRLAPAGDAMLPAAERRWEHLESLAGALISAAPAVVVLEDLHWADAMAVWLLEHLPRALDDARVAFVATSRDAEPDMPRLDTLRRVSRMLPLAGLDVDAVRRLAAAEAQGSIDAAGLHTRTGGNPLFVKELLRSPAGSGVIAEVLLRSLARFDTECAAVLATAAVAGSGTPLSVLAPACSCPTDVVVQRLEPAVRHGVLDDVSPAGVRFHHALLAEAAQRLGDPPALHGRLAAAWTVVDSIDGRAAAAGHRLRAAVDTPAVAGNVEKACAVAAELVALGRQPRAAALLWAAREAALRCAEPSELRANVALDLAEVLSWLGDHDPASSLYEEAAELARECADPVTRARAEVGANLWASAFVPDLPRLRR
ncbi:MAG: ATP-binding protein, partial [Pseudonocardia sp.]|nr:ATP-binding protein [Pseudonocardia sp.]